MSNRRPTSVKIFLALIALLSTLFFTNDFGLTDVQKTAIVIAVGIDKEEDDFLLTSQISIPKGSAQGASTEAVQLVSKGKTIAEAFEEINAKTGWFPKLVFCRLIVFGKDAAQENLFDALEFFLRDEYLTDDCALAVTESTAQELLDASALVDPASSLAITKVLSSHAERTGATLPATLKDFSIGYFGDSHSGYLPIVSKEKQQEASTPTPASSQSDEGGAKSGGESKEKPVFSAGKTALFVGGRWRETLTKEETFAVNAALGKLRLAGYSVPVGEETCSLLVKRNLPKISLLLGKKGRGELHVRLKMVAGTSDYSKAQPLEKTKDAGERVDGAFAAAEKKLAADLHSAFEKAKGVGCDLFDASERLTKFKRRTYAIYKDTLLENLTLSTEITFEGVR